MDSDTEGIFEELRIIMLGSFRVFIGTREISQDAWRRRKAQSLIKLLALTPGHRLHKEQLIEIFWPDLDLAAADNNLRQVLFLTRKLFTQAGLPGLKILPLSESWIELYPEGTLEVDVEKFERASADAKRKKSTESYRSALALYTGNLLPDDRYEEWVSTRRENLIAQYQQLWVDAARLHESSQEYQNAIECFLKAIDIEPADEESHLALIRLYALMGWRTQAIRQFQNLQKILKSELDVEPDPASLELYEAILDNRFPGKEHQTLRPFPSVLDLPKHNLPSHWTSFIGREAEISEIISFLSLGNDSNENRLLTILGPGGSGKTRLAIETAHRLQSQYPEGVWFVDLTGTANSEFVAHVVATTLGIREESQTPIDITLVKSLRPRCMLIVLDNCEHLIEACSSIAHQILSNCSQVRILATSRQTLGLHGEAVRHLDGLSVEDLSKTSPTQMLSQDSEAVRLFVERARLLQPNFRLDDHNLQAVTTICRQLDGLPLAIELAAARMNVLSPAQIASRLHDRFQLLSCENRQVIQRHRSLHAVIEWSYNLLNPSEQFLFESLAVFRGGCSLEAAEAVTVHHGLQSEDLLDLLSALIDKSLILTEISGNGELRYRCLETIREYAWERLQASGEAESLRRGHAAYFIWLAEQAEPRLRSEEQLTWFPRLDNEHGNLQAALEWSREADVETGLRLVCALWYYWYIRAFWAEGRQWFETILEAPPIDSPTYSKRKVFALACLAYLLIYMEEMETAQERIAESLELSQKSGSLEVLAFALKVQEYLFRKTDKFAKAEPLARQSVEIYQRLEQPWGIAGGLYALGVIADMYWHDTTRAHQYYSESHHWFQKSGDRRGCAYALNNLGNLAYKSGDFETAKANYQGCLSLSIELGDRLGTVIWLNNLSLLEVQLGNFDQAKRYLQEGLPIARAINHGWGIASMLSTLGDVVRYEGDLDQAFQKYEESLTKSRQLNEQMLIASALRGMGQTELAKGRLSSAENYQRQALAILKQAPNFYEEIPYTIEALAEVMLSQGRCELAARLYGSARALRCSLPRAHTAIDHKEFEANQARLKNLLGEPAYVTAWEQGLALSTDQAIQLTLNNEITGK